MVRQLVLAALAWAMAAAPVLAADDDAELAKKLANPVASLISVPLQNNVDCCFGPADAMRYTLNVQPVIPIKLTDDLSLVTRTIMPVIYEEGTTITSGESWGLGDITQSFFFVPALKGDVTVGVGPVFLWPVGTSGFGSREWAAGPTVLVLTQKPNGSGAHTTIGLLANHLWSYAGPEGRDSVSTTFLQPFFSYGFRDTTTVGINTETTYDWTHRAWTVPIIGTVSRVYRFGDQRVQLAGGLKYYATSPAGPNWGARFTATLLFPR